MKLYVYGKSKKDINERLAAGKAIYGTNHSVFGDGGDYRLDATLQNGTVIVVYERSVGGSPVGKSYGTWQKGKVA